MIRWAWIGGIGLRSAKANKSTTVQIALFTVGESLRLEF